MTFEELLATYVRYRILRSATVTNYQDALRNLERYFLSLGHECPPVDRLTIDHLLAHRQWCLERMRATSYNKLVLTP